MTLWDYALAANGSVAANWQTVTGYPASQAIDGSDVSACRTQNGTGAWFKVNLGAPQYITSIHLLHGASNYLANLNVQYCDDDATWNTLTTWAISGNSQTLDTGGITARYWRFVKSGDTVVGSVWELFTCELLGPVTAPPPPVNPAEAYITAWLDGIEANYVPTVEAWLAANP